MLKKIAALCFVGLLATAAHADTYTLTVSGCSTTCSPAPFGTITTSLNSGTNTVTVTETLASGVNFAASAGEALEFNLNAADGGAFTLGNFTSGFSQASGGPFTAPSLTSPPTAADLFNTAVQCNSCSGGNGPTSLSFTITGSSAITSLSNLFTPNGNGYVFTSDIFVNGNTGNVGALGGTPTTPTPEPSSLALLGTGIVGAATMLRRRIASLR